MLGYIVFITALVLITSSVSNVYAVLPAARSATVSGDVFLGGEYIELGISQYGSFGTDQNKPSGFFGTAARNNIGMSSDLDGFDTGTDWRMDFFYAWYSGGTLVNWLHHLWDTHYCF